MINGVYVSLSMSRLCLCFKDCNYNPVIDMLEFDVCFVCRHLKHEEKRCMEELQCNIVVMKRTQPKVLRLNLIGAQKKEVEEAGTSHSEQDDMPEKQTENKMDSLVDSIKGPNVTPTSSPELGTPFTATTEAGTSSASSSDPGTSPFCIPEMNGERKKEETIKESQELCDTNSDTESESLSTASASFRYQPWITELLLHQQSSQRNGERSEAYHGMPQATTTKALLEKYSRLDRGAGMEMSAAYRNDSDFSGNLREAIALSGNAPLGPPPLCSMCQHKAPVFGKPPRWFSYAELELATGGFSHANFLAEGGYGSVHRGVLPEGQVIAVKQHKLASSQGDVEFCSEVEVLSCAQHRNVVMLIGFCIEDKRRLLVYEYICNGSLDSHLYGNCNVLSNSWY